jgi:hypothetical protein
MEYFLIFLDVDGVLNTKREILEEYDDNEASPHYFSEKLCPDISHHITPLCKRFIDNLRWMIEQLPNTKIVLSSTWRQDDEYKRFLLAAFRSSGIETTCVVLGDTPTLSCLDGRGAEIRTWLLLNAEYGQKFVIIDDDHEISFGKHDLSDRFVKTILYDPKDSSKEGLSREAAELAVSILRRQSDVAEVRNGSSCYSLSCSASSDKLDPGLAAQVTQSPSDSLIAMNQSTLGIDKTHIHVNHNLLMAPDSDIRKSLRLASSSLHTNISDKLAGVSATSANVAQRSQCGFNSAGSVHDAASARPNPLSMQHAHHAPHKLS